MKIKKEYLKKLENVAQLSTDDNVTRYIEDISKTIEAGDSLAKIPNIDKYEPTFHSNFAKDLSLRKRTIQNEPFNVQENIKNLKDNLIKVQNERGNESE